MKRAIASLACCCALGCASSPPVSPGAAGQRAVDVTPSHATVSVARGGTSTLTLGLAVADGLHIQGNPAARDELVPLEITFKAGPSLSFGRASYPTARPYRVPGMSEALLVYDGELAVSAEVSAGADASLGQVVATADVHYQACDHRTCLRPESIAVQFPIRITP